MEAQRNVSRDGFVEVAKAYYEAPWSTTIRIPFGDN
jgi:hypothetical protein